MESWAFGGEEEEEGGPWHPTGQQGGRGVGEGLQKWEVGSLLDLKSGARGPGSTPNRAPLLYR